MMRRLYDRLYRVLVVLFVVFAWLSFAPVASASPFGEGVFGAHIPFGAITSIGIALGGNVSLTLAPSGSTMAGSGSHTITITSTDVVGYSIYVYGLGGTNMVSGANTIPASSNSSPGALATNTWGYNTDGTSNYLGMTTTPTLLKTATGPFETGDNTTVTYGVITDITQITGNYSVTVVYTVVALND